MAARPIVHTAGLALLFDPEEFLFINAISGNDELELSINIQPDGGEVLLIPLLGCNHGEQVAPASVVEIVGLTHHGLEVDIGLVGELVPIEVGDGGHVLLADLDELLLEVTLDLGDAPGLKGSQVVGDDGWGEGGGGVGEKGSRGFLVGPDPWHCCQIRLCLHHWG